MSNPAQGAVGAETMTAADPDINEFGRVVWHSSDEDSGPDVGVTIGFGSGRALWFGEISKKMHEEEGAEAAELGSDLGTWIVLYDDNKPRGQQATVIGKAIPYVGTDVCDAISASLKAALVSPRADSDERTAGAVPDSLRALSEAASALLSACMADMGPLDEMDRDDEPVGMSGFGVGTAVTFGHLRRLERALASHPAGQSAGSGTDTLAASLAEFQRRNGYHKREIEELLTEFGELLLSKVVSAPDSTRTGQVGLREALARSLTKSVAGGSPDRYRIEIACPDLATMQVLRDGLVSLRDNPTAITAPHDDGFTADELREIRAAIMELGAGAIRTQKITDHQAAEDLQRHCIGRIERALASRLAARPAAPEAQGLEKKPDTDDPWIKVEDQLPGEQGQDSEEVIVFLNGHCDRLDDECRKGGAWGHRFGWFDADRQCFRVHGRPDVSVTHWMPKPAPPASSGQGGR